MPSPPVQHRSRRPPGRRRPGLLACWLLAPLLCILVAQAATAAQPVKRTVLALYDGQSEAELRFFRVHLHAEMPLNHLGLEVDYHDVRRGLPDPGRMTDVRGILIWDDLRDVQQPLRWLQWLADAAGRGVRLAIMHVLPGVEADADSVLARAAAQVLRHTGAVPLAARARPTFRDSIVHAEPGLVGFERPLSVPLPRYQPMQATPEADAALRVRRQRGTGSIDSTLIAFGAGGAYADPAYVLYIGTRPAQKRWLLDPFTFFERAFDTAPLPRPDTTTLAGRRIYYSHIDGDGWRNVSTVEGYQHGSTLSAKVVLEEAIRPYPDLPVTVAPISADLDLDWYGSREARDVARELFILPQVEVASHTHTHPFDWGFYAAYQPRSERAFLDAYRRVNGERRALHPAWQPYLEEPAGQTPELALDNYSRPRTYGLEPFDLQAELGGSIERIAALAPQRKPVEVVQWSGNTSPFPAALRALTEQRLLNINGGDTRFDTHYPSYAYVAAIGRPVGPFRQIYASNSNENTYTNLWRGPYFGFRYLTETFERTESPRRVKPANIYYHMYSGEKPAALQALLDNLEWARAAQIAPITTSHFIRIALGFYTTRLTELGPQHWRVDERGALNTLRFDSAGTTQVDWARSRGVIGQRLHQGSLYVALDPAETAVEVALTGRDTGALAPAYLVHSRWPVRGLRRQGEAVLFDTGGFGAGHMVWHARSAARYRVTATRDVGQIYNRRVTASADGQLAIDLGRRGLAPMQVRIEPVN